MSDFEDQARSLDELREIGERLRAARAEPTPAELDAIKRRVLASQAKSASRRSGLVRRLPLPVPIAAAIAALAVVAGGMGGFVASGGFEGAGSPHSAASKQYCPPSSQQPGKPKPPPQDGCGKPKTK